MIPRKPLFRTVEKCSISRYRTVLMKYCDSLMYVKNVNTHVGGENCIKGAHGQNCQVNTGHVRYAKLVVLQMTNAQCITVLYTQQRDESSVECWKGVCL